MVSLLAFIILALCTRTSRSIPNDSSSSILSRIKNSTKCRKFMAYLDGDQEVPPIDAPGSCTGILRLNNEMNELFYRVRLCKGLTGQPSAAQIRRGVYGENGSVLVELLGLTGDTNFLAAEGYIKAVEIGNNYFNDLVDVLFSGEAYFNVDTKAYPDGEVRGQIIPPENCLEEEEEEEEVVIPDLCKLPADIGRCKGYFRKYFFNTASQTCEMFIYGGCGGNSNNFESLSGCESKCGGRQNDGGQPGDRYLESEEGGDAIEGESDGDGEITKGDGKEMTEGEVSVKDAHHSNSDVQIYLGNVDLDAFNAINNP